MPTRLESARARLIGGLLLAVLLAGCLPVTTVSGGGTVQAASFGKDAAWRGPQKKSPATTTTTTAPPSTTTTTAPPTTTSTLLTDDFNGPAATWSQGSVVGPWVVRYNGYGRVGLAGDGTVALAPQAVTDPGSTSAALVTSVTSFSGDLDVRARMRTAKQLRQGTAPNAWEVAWLVWNYQSDHRFYYLIAKPNGWELGKVDDSKLDPAGPDCRWPEYVNCRYPGGQRFLATASAPAFAVGDWHDLRIVQQRNVITVHIDGQQLTSFTDTLNAYTSGAVGLYTEDADIRVDRVTIARP